MCQLAASLLSKSCATSETQLAVAGLGGLDLLLGLLEGSQKVRQAGLQALGALLTENRQIIRQLVGLSPTTLLLPAPRVAPQMH